MNHQSENQLTNVPALRPVNSHQVLTKVHALPKAPDTITPAFVVRSVRQWWKIALPIGILMAAAGISVAYLTFQPSYRASALLLIKDQPDYVLYKPNEGGSRFVQNQLELIRGPLVMEKVLAKPEVAQLSEVSRQAMPLEWLERNVSARNLGASEYFELSYTCADPSQSAAIANAISDAFLEISTQTSARQTERIIQLLSEQRDIHLNKVSQLRERVRTLAKAITGKDPFAPGANRDVPEHNPLADLQSRLVTTEVDREVVEARIKALEESIAAEKHELSAETIERLVAEHPEVVRLKDGINLAKAQFKEMQRVAQPSYAQGPSRLKSEIETDEQRLIDLQEQLKTAIAKELAASEVRKMKETLSDLHQQDTNLQVAEKQLKEHVAKLTVDRVDTGDSALELEQAKDEMDRAEGIYQRITDRIITFSTESRAPERVISWRRATVPTEPEVKSPVKMAAMAGLACLLFPFVIAIAWERHVRRIVEPQQITEEMFLPVVAEVSTLPYRRLGKNSRASHVSWAHCVFEESVEGLRTTLVLADHLKHIQTIAVVSSVSREGKTSLSAQLAISLARTVGSPVLLIDGDTRSPDLHHMFDVPKEPGLVKALASGGPISDYIQATDAHPLVHLLPAGNLHQSPHSLMGNNSWKNLLEQARGIYRYVVIDTPPVLSASESMVIAKAADGVLICTLRETSRSAQVRMTYERLAHSGAQIIGVVLSGVPTKQYYLKYGSYAYNQKT